MGLISASNLIAGCLIALIICIIIVIAYVIPGNRTPEDEAADYKIAMWTGVAGGIIAVIMGALIYFNPSKVDPEYARINHLPIADKN